MVLCSILAQINKTLLQYYFIIEVNLQRQHSNSDSSGQNVQLAQVRQIHKSISDFLYSLLEGTDSKSSLQEKKNEIKNYISDLMSFTATTDVINFIIHDTKRTEASVIQQTDSIDHVQDAERLRLVI